MISAAPTDFKSGNVNAASEAHMSERSSEGFAEQHDFQSLRYRAMGRRAGVWMCGACRAVQILSARMVKAVVTRVALAPIRISNAITGHLVANKLEYAIAPTPTGTKRSAMLARIPSHTLPRATPTSPLKCKQIRSAAIPQMGPEIGS